MRVPTGELIRISPDDDLIAGLITWNMSCEVPIDSLGTRYDTVSGELASPTLGTSVKLASSGGDEEAKVIAALVASVLSMGAPNMELEVLITLVLGGQKGGKSISFTLLVSSKTEKGSGRYSMCVLAVPMT